MANLANHCLQMQGFFLGYELEVAEKYQTFIFFYFHLFFFYFLLTLKLGFQLRSFVSHKNKIGIWASAASIGEVRGIESEFGLLISISYESLRLGKHRI